MEKRQIDLYRKTFGVLTRTPQLIHLFLVTSTNCPICSKALIKDRRFITLWEARDIYRCPDTKEDEFQPSYHYFCWFVFFSVKRALIEEYVMENFHAVVESNRTLSTIRVRGQVVQEMHRVLTASEIQRMDRVWVMR